MGLNPINDLTRLAIQIISESNVVYLESYTSPQPQDIAKEIEALTGKKIQLAKREFVEDGRQILENAVKENAALLVPGDPAIATTHGELMVRAKEKGIATKLIHNVSVTTAVAGETGLHSYKFGRTVTATRGSHQSQFTLYSSVHENLTRGIHTIILLEYDHESHFFLPPSQALESLLEMEQDNKWGTIREDSITIIASRLGLENQRIEYGRLGQLQRKDFGDPPHTIILPGSLHFTEVEALKTLVEGDIKDIVDNSKFIGNRSESMVRKYSAKSRSALEKARRITRENNISDLDDLLENVECYTSDAERFLHEGRFELAVLSIGYAEGLLDSLSYTKRSMFGEIWN